MPFLPVTVTLFKFIWTLFVLGCCRFKWGEWAANFCSIAFVKLRKTNFKLLFTWILFILYYIIYSFKEPFSPDMSLTLYPEYIDMLEVIHKLRWQDFENFWPIVDKHQTLNVCCIVDIWLTCRLLTCKCSLWTAPKHYNHE